MAGNFLCVALGLSSTLLATVHVQSQTCSSDIVTTDRFISYPDLHNKEQYKNNEDCVWFIAAKGTNRFELTVSYIDVEPHLQCIYDNVKIYEVDEHTKNGNLLGFFCGNLTNPNLPIMYTRLKWVAIRFHSDEQNTATGFKMEYREFQESLCINYEVSVIGTLQSLDADNDGYYDNDVDCYWTITWPHLDIDVIRQFYVARMDIQWSPDCEIDYLLILEEVNYVGSFCGREIPPLYVQQTATLYVKFHSNSSINLKGFLAIYAAKGNQCGGILTSKEGEIPPADNNQDGHSDDPYLFCVWAVVAPENLVVSFEVSKVDMDANPSCDYEFVAFYDGTLDKDGYLFHACGYINITLGPFVTMTNILFVDFRSNDMYLIFRGFRVAYMHIKGNGSYGTTSRIPYSTKVATNRPPSVNHKIGGTSTITDEEITTSNDDKSTNKGSFHTESRKNIETTQFADRQTVKTTTMELKSNESEFNQTTEATTLKLPSHLTTKLAKQGTGRGVSSKELFTTQQKSGFDFTSSKTNLLPIICTGLMFAFCL